MSRRHIDALQHYKPWARWLMQSRAWWVVLGLHAIFSPPVIVVINFAASLRESWAEYAELFGTIRRDRAAFVRGREAQQ